MTDSLSKHRLLTAEELASLPKYGRDSWAKGSPCHLVAFSTRERYFRGQWDAAARLMDYIDDWGKEIHWAWAEDFEAVLAFDGYYRGRSAAGFWWRDTETGVYYPMFMRDAELLLKFGPSTAGSGLAQTTGEPVRVTATWRFIKRGSNYGIQVL